MPEILHTCPTCGIPNFTPKGLKAHKCKGPKAQPVEVLGAAATLPEIALALETRRDEISAWESKFLEGTLEARLQIGLQCLKANEVFALTNSELAALGGRAKAAVSRRDTAETEAVTTGETAPNPEPATYTEWLETAAPWLNRATAYKYADAVQGLGCDASSTPEQVAKGLQSLRSSNAKASLPAPSLASLVKAHALALKDAEAAANSDPAQPPPDKDAIRIGDARERFQKIRDQWEESLTRGQLDDLPKEDLKALDEFHQSCRDRIKARLKS